MRNVLPATLACLLLAPLAAEAQTQPLPKLVIGAPGRCEMAVNGDPRTCTSGLIYVQHVNGAVLLSVQAGQGVTIGFQANSDRQPKPEQYILVLNRMHTSVDGKTAAKDVTGTCEINMSTDGQTWHSATCRAEDRSHLVTTMTFTGNGQQVTAARPNEENRQGPPTGTPMTPRGVPQRG